MAEWRQLHESDSQELTDNINFRKELPKTAYESLKCLQDCQDATAQISVKRSRVVQGNWRGRGAD